METIDCRALLSSPSAGFFVDKMSVLELAEIKSYIFDQYCCRIMSVYPDQSQWFYSQPIEQYHILSDLVDHKSLWPKRARILGPNSVKRIKQMPFFKKLCTELSIECISGEEESGWEEMYWRIVRPGAGDIGSLHADSWFWKFGHGKLPDTVKRIKIWIAIEVERELSGLRVVPGSHYMTHIKYHGEKDHTGIIKPKLDTPESSLTIYNVPTSPGDYVVFHDDLLHGGMTNYSNKTRVSLEATLLVSST